MLKHKTLLTTRTLYELVKDLKRAGKRIGFTHGAFDLFHFAHLDLLKKSASICDFLIVGVDSDKSIAMYKSYRRPIIEQRHRLKIVNELDCVDAVFVKDIPMDREAHISLYKDLMVDIVTIGTRFEERFRELIRAETEEVGAKLIDIDTEQDLSSSAIINTIIDKYSESTFKFVPREQR